MTSQNTNYHHRSRRVSCDLDWSNRSCHHIQSLPFDFVRRWNYLEKRCADFRDNVKMKIFNVVIFTTIFQQTKISIIFTTTQICLHKLSAFLWLCKSDIKTYKRSENCHFTSKDVEFMMTSTLLHKCRQQCSSYGTCLMPQKIMTIHHAFSLFAQQLLRAFWKAFMQTAISVMHSKWKQNTKCFCDISSVDFCYATLYSFAHFPRCTLFAAVKITIIFHGFVVCCPCFCVLSEDMFIRAKR